MSTATPPSPAAPVRPASSSARPAPGAPAAAPTGFANIDPIRLLRRYWPLLTAAAIVGGVLGAAGHFILLKLSPTYTASVTFQCSPPTDNILQPRSGAGIQQQDFDRYMGTQMALMTSYEILTNALRNPDLVQTRWAKRFTRNGSFQPLDALPALQDSLSPRLIPQTSLIRLSMNWRDPNDVRTIVDAVSKAYMDDVRNTTNRTTVERRGVLEQRRRDIEAEVKTLSRNRETILTNNRITNLREGANAEEQKQLEIIKSLAEVNQSLVSVVSRLDRMRNAGLENGRPVFAQDMVEESENHPILRGLTADMSELKVQEQSLRQQGYGDEHPAIVSIRNRHRAAQARYDDEKQTILQQLHDAQAETLTKTITSLEAQKAKLDKDLEETSNRKQDLLKALLQVEEIDNRIASLNDELQVTLAAKQNLELLTNQVFDQVRIIIPAQTPNRVTFPKLAIMVPLGVLLIAGLTASIVLVREIMDQRVKGPADVAMIPRLRVLGMVPDAAEDPARPAAVETAFRDTPGGVVTESFRQLRSPIVKKMDTDGLRTCLVIAGMPGSGATTVAANLAISCASADENVLIIDANVRRPAMHRVFGITEPLGLADCLAGQTSLDEAVRTSSVANLSVLTAGSPGNRMVPERLSSEAMSRLLAEAAAKYDRVFIDCPPAIVSGDGVALANRCDAVIMVVRALAEKRGLVNRIRTQLAEAHAELVGVVVNAVKSSAGGYFKRNIQATHEYHNPSASA